MDWLLQTLLGCISVSGHFKLTWISIVWIKYMTSSAFPWETMHSLWFLRHIWSAFCQIQSKQLLVQFESKSRNLKVPVNLSCFCRHDLAYFKARYSIFWLEVIHSFNIGWAFPVGIQIKIQIGQNSELYSNLNIQWTKDWRKWIHSPAAHEGRPLPIWWVYIVPTTVVSRTPLGGFKAVKDGKALRKYIWMYTVELMKHLGHWL